MCAAFWTPNTSPISAWLNQRLYLERYQFLKLISSDILFSALLLRLQYFEQALKYQDA